MTTTEEPAHITEERLQSVDALASSSANGSAPDATALDRLRSQLLNGSAILELPEPAPLIKGWLDVDALAVIFGRPKGGKSFVVLDMALCVATGSWWHSHEVTQGPVVYVIAEGARGTGPRVDAWCDVNRVYTVPNTMHWLPVAVNMLNPAMAGALTHLCVELQPVLVVIDTLNRTMAGGDENGPRDMSTYIAAADVIKQRTGACVLIVHHSGKDTSAGARGHSSLLGAVDCEIEVKKAEGIITVATTAVKDHPEDPTPMRFMLLPSGKSAAIASYTGRSDGGITNAGTAVLDALRSIELPGGIATSVWRDTVLESGATSKTTFYAQVRELVGLGLIKNVGTDRQPRYITASSPTSDDPPCTLHDQGEQS